MQRSETQQDGERLWPQSTYTAVQHWNAPFSSLSPWSQSCGWKGAEERLPGEEVDSRVIPRELFHLEHLRMRGWGLARSLSMLVLKSRAGREIKPRGPIIARLQGAFKGTCWLLWDFSPKKRLMSFQGQLHAILIRQLPIWLVSQNAGRKDIQCQLVPHYKILLTPIKYGSQINMSTFFF